MEVGAVLESTAQLLRQVFERSDGVLWGLSELRFLGIGHGWWSQYQQ